MMSSQEIENIETLVLDRYGSCIHSCCQDGKAICSISEDEECNGEDEHCCYYEKVD